MACYVERVRFADGSTWATDHLQLFLAACTIADAKPNARRRKTSSGAASRFHFAYVGR